jgi:hypothetical protein
VILHLFTSTQTLEISLLLFCQSFVFIIFHVYIIFKMLCLDYSWFLPHFSVVLFWDLWLTLWVVQPVFYFYFFWLLWVTAICLIWYQYFLIYICPAFYFIFGCWDLLPIVNLLSIFAHLYLPIGLILLCRTIILSASMCWTNFIRVYWLMHS